MFGYEADLKLFYQLISGEALEIKNAELLENALDFAVYTVLMLGFTFVVTKGIKWIILRYRLDLRFYDLQIYNYWYLVFNARLLDKRLEGKRDQTDLVYVDILAENNIVYSGFLFDFTYSPTKDILQNIVLKTAVKRTFQNKSGDNPILQLTKASNIQGHALIILGKDILNINISYLQLESINEHLDVKEILESESSINAN